MCKCPQKMSRHHKAMSILLGLLAVASVCFSYVIQRPDEEDYAFDEFDYGAPEMDFGQYAVGVLDVIGAPGKIGGNIVANMFGGKK